MADDNCCVGCNAQWGCLIGTSCLNIAPCASSTRFWKVIIPGSRFPRRTSKAWMDMKLWKYLAKSKVLFKPAHSKHMGRGQVPTHQQHFGTTSIKNLSLSDIEEELNQLPVINNIFRKSVPKQQPVLCKNRPTERNNSMGSFKRKKMKKKWTWSSSF